MCDWVYMRANLVFGNYGLDSFCQIWHKRTIFKFYGRIPDSSILGFCLWIRATRIGVSTNGILLQNLPMYVHPFGKDDFGIYISHILLLSDLLYTLRSKCCWLLLILCTFHAVAVSCCWCCCYVVYVVDIEDFVGSCFCWQCLFLLAMFVIVGNVCLCWLWLCLFMMEMFVFDGNACLCLLLLTMFFFHIGISLHLSCGCCCCGCCCCLCCCRCCCYLIAPRIPPG